MSSKAISLWTCSHCGSNAIGEVDVVTEVSLSPTRKEIYGVECLMPRDWTRNGLEDLCRVCAFKVKSKRRKK